jgi:hypothetical protein
MAAGLLRGNGMRRAQKRIRRERKTIAAMIAIYCRDHHDGGRSGLCPECAALHAYAEQRLDKCPFGETKPTCVKCPIHCYKPACREQVREVMRYAGPRMLVRHPVLAIRHLLDERQPPPELPRKKANAAAHAE